MKLIENINISMSLNKGKKEIMFESLNEILQYYKPCEDLVKSIKKEEEKDSIVGYVKAVSFNQEDQDFIQLFKKNSYLDVYNVILDNIRIYRGFMLPFESEGAYRSKMIQIDDGKTEGLEQLKDYI
jgi:hypothetical protein